MQLSLRVPPKTGERLKSLAAKTGKTKTALILEALDEKYEPKKDRSQLIRELAGWMSKADCKQLRESLADFDTIDDEDWRLIWSSTPTFTVISPRAFPKRSTFWPSSGSSCSYRLLSSVNFRMVS